MGPGRTLVRALLLGAISAVLVALAVRFLDELLGLRRGETRRRPPPIESADDAMGADSSELSELDQAALPGISIRAQAVLRHVALFRWKPKTTAKDVSNVEAALHQLPAKIPCIRSYRFGRDLGVQDGNADFALVADFADQDGLRTYATHPDHQAVAQKLIRPIMAQRVAIPYVIDHSD